ncbi:hypothetical protein ASPZODRAFT_127852 [Penicilliopsis zonata CBS 506.65]|uniref:MFS transporter Fmp42 n=1 Tax=Penicilliopsis zonata CBS 506.65 TaxID=1073090 RepID=A0A1L9SWZ5_9EURO|nr:hypothetical protein ASPZODRAFT_127852 [Penicilliopsis zonata CBS 506.65]OJJ51728.1 hypothetical protein ASPZODRAFT_127852 [Penicilliopsis zonata CBS 506.65]
MSLPRVSYLESWEHSPAAFWRRQSSITDSEPEDELHQELPETSLSSSFPSIYSHHRLNFNPYAAPGWSRASVEDANDDRVSFFQSSSANVHKNNHTEIAPDELEPQYVAFKEPEGIAPLTTGAFEVSKAKRIVQVFIAVVYCFLAAGVVFGFAAIKPVLIREGVYRHLCSQEELDTGALVCYGQEIRLNLMFTIAAVATNVSALPVGTILDTYGPRVCGIIGSVCLALGAVLFGFAAQLPFDGYIPGYLFLSLGGPFVFISSFHLSNTFPARSGLILSMLTGAFDASSALFLVFRLVNEKTGGAFSTTKLFSIYLTVPLFILFVQLSVMPATSYKTVGELVVEAETQIMEEVHDQVDASIPDPREGERQRNDRRMHRHSIVSQIQDLLQDSPDESSPFQTPTFPGSPGSPESPENNGGSQQQPRPAALKPKPPASQPAVGGVWGAMHGFSALQQIQSPWFILITLFTVLQMLRINYFVASIRQQYAYLLDSPALARQINDAFDLLLPLGGLVSVPFIGTVLDSLPTRTVLALLVGVASLIGLLGCIPACLPAAYANLVLFVLYRPFYYTAVSDYAAKVFGFQTFGKVYGLIICLAGMGNFAQTALDTLTFKSFHRNPIPVNAALTLAACAVGVVLVIFVSVRVRAMAAAGVVGEMDVQDDCPSSPQVSEQVQIAVRDWEREPLIRDVQRSYV